jgi:hypothetical protein
MRAAAANRGAAVHLLMRAFPTLLNARDYHGATAAWHACACDAADALGELVQSGCDLTIGDSRFGQTPVDIAVEHVRSFTNLVFFVVVRSHSHFSVDIAVEHVRSFTNLVVVRSHSHFSVDIAVEHVRSFTNLVFFVVVRSHSHFSQCHIFLLVRLDRAFTSILFTAKSLVVGGGIDAHAHLPSSHPTDSSGWWLVVAFVFVNSQTGTGIARLALKSSHRHSETCRHRRPPSSRTQSFP